MPVRKEEYEDIKACMSPGDVIAFSSNGLFSTVIKLVTSSHVSHVGIVVPSECLEGANPDDIVIAEATENGVEFRSLDSRVRDSDVEMLWWLKLTPDHRCRLKQNSDAFCKFLKTHKGRPYDISQALQLGITCFEPVLESIHKSLDKKLRVLVRVVLCILNVLNRDEPPDVQDSSSPPNTEKDAEIFFCSELVAGALKAGGVITGVESSKVTPIDMCRFNLYEEEYVQFKGEERTRIRGFNSAKPSRWDERPSGLAS